MAIHKQQELDLIAPVAIDQLQKFIAGIQTAIELDLQARSDFFKSGLNNLTDDLRTAELNLELACFDAEEIIRMFGNPVRARAELKLVGGDKDE